MAKGFAAVCCNENPNPIINRPEINSGKDSALAAGINNNVPTADIINPILIPFFYLFLLSKSCFKSLLIKKYNKAPTE